MLYFQKQQPFQSEKNQNISYRTAEFKLFPNLTDLPKKHVPMSTKWKWK